MAQYELLTSFHTEVNSDGEAIKYKKGDVIDSDTDLAKKFTNKFKKLDEVRIVEKEVQVVKYMDPTTGKEMTQEQVEALQTPAEDPLAAADTPPNEEDPIDTSEYGERVTDDFEAAKECEVEVYKKGGWYNLIVDGEPIKKLRADKVDDFIYDYFEEEDDSANP